MFLTSFSACTLLSWVGYLFACCLATSIAAQSGAAAGLGMSLIIKTIVVEVSLDNYLFFDSVFILFILANSFIVSTSISDPNGPDYVCW